MSSEKSEDLVNPLEDVLGYQLRRASMVTFGALMEQYEALSLKPTEAVILRLVAANPGCNQSAIGRALGVKRTNMVPVVAALEARGFIVRTPADGRSNALRITAAGEELLGKVVACGAEIEQRFFGEVPPELSRAMIALCKEVRHKGDN